jgi:hypothetical protein
VGIAIDSTGWMTNTQNWGSGFGSTFGNNTTIGVAVDLDNNTMHFTNGNGMWRGGVDPLAPNNKYGLDISGLTGAVVPTVSTNVGSTSTVVEFNFGDRRLYHRPPNGYNTGWYNISDTD